MRTSWITLLATLVLTACGGGGGGAASSPGSPTAGAPTLAFSPTTVNATVQAGLSSTISVQASVNNPADFNGASAVYAYVIDTTGVIQPSAQITQQSATSYTAVLHTATTLAAGNYQGNFTVKVCRDSACAGQFPGSPMLLPYNLTVTPGSGAPPQPAPALSFAPATASAAVQAGLSQTLTLAATVNTPADFSGASTVYASIVDSRGVILPDAQVVSTGAASYSVVLHTAPTLAAGNYSGSFSVRLCRDAACATHFPGSPMLLPYVFSVSALPVFSAVPARSLANSVHLGAAAPASTIVNVKAADRIWRASTAAPWLALSGASGSGDGAFVASVDVTGLAVGSYPASITVSASDGQVSTLPVTLTILPNVFTVDKTGLAFNAINGAPIATQAIRFDVDSPAGVAWSASSDASWLGLTPASGSTPGSTTLAVDPAAGKLASGSYVGAIKLLSPQATPRQLPVTLTLTRASLTASAATLVLGGSYGRDFSAKPWTLNLNTLGNAWPWTLSALPAWASASAVGGVVNQTGSSIAFMANAAQAPYGSSSGALTATVTVNGDTLSVPLNLTINRDKHRLLPSETGVALSATPQWSRLTRTLTVADNYGKTPLFGASADQPWLQVSVLNNTVSLVADASQLPVNAISYATVTLTPGDASIVASEPIRVALWNGAATPAATTKLTQTYSRVQVDPIRPYAYVHNGGSAIDVYNVYTAQRVATIGALGAALGDMAVSPNGDHLYVYDTSNATIAVVNLATQSKTASWPLARAVSGATRIRAIRPNGVEVLLAGDGKAYLAENGKVVASNVPGGDSAATNDGKHLYIQDTGTSPAQIYAYTLDYSEMSGGQLFIAPAGSGWWVGGASNGQDIAVSGDGARLYTASGAPYRCGSVNPATLTFIGGLPGGDAYPNNVEVGSDGRVFCGISGVYSTADVWVHRADGSLQTSFKFAGYARELLARQLAVSGDGLVIVALTSDPLLVFVPVGP